MKAKEIAKKLQDENYSAESITWYLKHISSEIQRLIKARNATTDRALAGIVKDQFQQWKAVSKRCEGVLKPDDFWIALETITSEKTAQKVKLAIENPKS